MGLFYIGWTTDIGGQKICRIFEFNNFVEAVRFVNEIATITEEAWHHPDVHIFYNKVVLDLTTHDVSGVSEKDYILAGKIDEISK
ncbi:MAG: hypothetical protein UY83_C0004G0006 [Candidatus Adlerbacteria bacterium GW2011_GWA1_54_10]|nr:MAG: hypothetical protein UY83_C0004G0006 [Candidatus Adlerbacteria bacterium GW2011_GWA1_54_10]